MKFAFFYISITLITLFAQAQNSPDKGQIAGKIIDASTNTAIDYATISVFKSGSTSPFTGTVAKSDGSFVIKNLPLGTFNIKIDFLGYQSKTIETIALTETAPIYSAGNILLPPTINQLKGVTVIGTLPTIENRIDKLIYNPGNDLSAQGGVAVDILRKVPEVTVDIDGNVELQGNANVRFLINGKPSSIFGANLADALQSIPASQIKSVEVITSPGAKYDSNGSGGIINLILKDSKIEGFNGTSNLAVGIRRNTGSVNLNFRHNKLAVNAFVNGNMQFNSLTKNSIDNLSYNFSRDTSTQLFQNGNSDFVRKGYQTGINFNYAISKKDDITAAIGFNQSERRNEGLTDQDQTVFDLQNNNIISQLYSLRNSNTNGSSNTLDYSLNYKKKFDKDGQELDFNFSSSAGKNQSDFFQQQTYSSGRLPTGVRSNNPGKDRESNFSLDFTYPVSKSFIIETGAKAILQNIDNSTVSDTLGTLGFVNNANQTYGFSYDRDIYATYLSAQFPLFNNFLNAKLGLRDELTVSKVDYANTQIPTYNTLAPSGVLSHKINDSQTIKLSYSFRIQRPGYNDVNPFYDISDVHNIRTGNPDLKPEKTNNYTLGYNQTLKNGANFLVSAFYRYNSDNIQNLTSHFDTLIIGNNTYSNVFLNKRYNIGRETNVGLSASGSVTLIEKLNLRTNLMLNRRTNENPDLPTVSGLNYRINLNASYEFNSSFMAEIFGNYNSSVKTIQGNRPAFALYNLAIRKQFFNKKFSLGVTATNPFNKYINQQRYTSGALFQQTNLRQLPLQSFGIALSYRFGKLEFKKRKEMQDDPNQNINPDMD